MGPSLNDLRVMKLVYLQEVAEHDVSLSPQSQRNTHTVGVHLIVVALGEGRGGEGRGGEGRGGEGRGGEGRGGEGRGEREREGGTR